MDNTVIISPIVFDLVFYFVILLMGIDFLLSGFLVLIKNARALEKPKFLGLWLIKITHASESKSKGHLLYSFIFRLRNMGWYFFFGGVLTVLGALLMLYDVLFQF